MDNRPKVVLTGATGFVGAVVLKKLIELELTPIVVKRATGQYSEKRDEIVVHSIDATTDWKDSLSNVDVVIHCAARAHVMNEESVDPLTQYRKVNTAGTLNFAKQAANSGVKRFIFISSIKVNGEQTDIGLPFKPDIHSATNDPYGLSKYEAELGLRNVAAQTAMEVVIIRPTLVYGPGVKANFATMLNLASKPIPLVFSGIKHNRRSMVCVDNLVDLIVTCIAHPNAANETFLVSDNDDLSTADMFQRLNQACGKSAIAIPIPEIVFKKIFSLMGKSGYYQRLCGSLQVDISHTINRLDWHPPYSVNACFKKTADDFLKNK